MNNNNYGDLFIEWFVEERDSCPVDAIDKHYREKGGTLIKTMLNGDFTFGQLFAYFVLIDTPKSLPGLLLRDVRIVVLPLFWDGLINCIDNDPELRQLTYRTDSGYLKHPTWQIKRQIMWLFSGCVCALCGCELKYTFHLHHNNYDNVPMERMIDLTVLCEDCHLGYHTSPSLKEIRSEVLMLQELESRVRVRRMVEKCKKLEVNPHLLGYYLRDTDKFDV